MNTRSFNEQVYALIRLIPPGKVLTYGRVAALLGVPRGARAVGWAMRVCPADVPWHRVINAQRRVSTPCEEHDPHSQCARLEAEGLKFDEQRRLPSQALWQPSPWEIQDRLENG